MNKSGVILIFVLGLLVFSGFALAANCTSFNYSAWNSCSAGTQTRTLLNSTPANCTGGNPILSQNCSSAANIVNNTVNLSKIDKGFACLVDKIKTDCSGATTVQELSLTILASTSATQKCYEKLKDFERSGNCFGSTTSCSVRDTALAILALNHVGQSTKVYESWLMNQTITATDLIWYLEQDSNARAGCKVSYDSVDYAFNVLENKKLDGSAGNCLTPAQSNYWFQVSPACYDKTFSLICDVDYIATLLYKQPNSPTVYVLSGTKSAQANQPVDLSIRALCFGTNTCDYEASAWATVALETTGNDIEAYIPYLIANEDANQRYLPEAFLQILKDFSEYGTKLIQKQELNSWEAENTAYNKYYDTALALLALSNSNQQQVINARNWFTNTAPGADGCWNNGNIRDTAIALWALAGRSATVSGSTSIPQCTEFGFFCITSTDCPDEQILGNYRCSALGKKCCQTENLQACSEMDGKVCASDKECSGISKRASDTEKCCLEDCQTPEVKQSACESIGGSCRVSCSSVQTEIDSSCDDSSYTCCKVTTTGSDSGGMSWWIWLLIVLIILVALAIVFRERLKVLLYKMKSGFKEDKGGHSGGVPPGFGPYFSDNQIQQPRPMMRPASPQQRPQPSINRLPIRR